MILAMPVLPAATSVAVSPLAPVTVAPLAPTVPVPVAPPVPATLVAVEPPGMLVLNISVPPVVATVPVVTQRLAAPPRMSVAG